eukprot:TRINITY_DN10296_c0_g1_i4.p2 TRINITY_DN10296_c0_g1~~TRINITY_DN10296_c0_g1_i4.p2  ORF type:complete len:122 (+),score=5.74 TRINITY_DN10296_c0_g1_i4:339-704(+)
MYDLPHQTVTKQSIQGMLSNEFSSRIYGLPHQTMTQWTHDLEAVLQLDINHLSLYELTLKPNTPLWRAVKSVPDQDCCVLTHQTISLSLCRPNPYPFNLAFQSRDCNCAHHHLHLGHALAI